MNQGTLLYSLMFTAAICWSSTVQLSFAMWLGCTFHIWSTNNFSKYIFFYQHKSWCPFNFRCRTKNTLGEDFTIYFSNWSQDTWQIIRELNEKVFWLLGSYVQSSKEKLDWKGFVPCVLHIFCFHKKPTNILFIIPDTYCMLRYLHNFTLS